jgi:NAD(P)-dependent dehydrogenase (short-subunit alcohol dehydrogenase family)
VEGKVVLITGGNSGIGKWAAIGLAQMGATVVITSRDADRGQTALREIREQSGSDDVEVMELDLAAFASIRAFAAAFLDRYDRLDVLINNAGGILSDRSETAEGFETTFGVNHLGHFLLTDLLLDRIKASAPSRIINVSSMAHRGAVRGMNFDDLQSATGRYSPSSAYAQSKLANILFTRELARRLDGTGVTVNALHPGGVSSGFGREGDTARLARLVMFIAQPFLISSEKGARCSIYLASSPEVEGVSGEFFQRNRPARTTAAARDDEAARRLWDVSEELVAAHPA